MLLAYGMLVEDEAVVVRFERQGVPQSITVNLRNCPVVGEEQDCSQ